MDISIDMVLRGDSLPYKFEVKVQFNLILIPNEELFYQELVDQIVFVFYF